MMGTATVKKRGKMERTGVTKATTERAKNLFLFGNGDGKPVCDIVKLAHLSGAGISTIEKWWPVWKREAREIAVAGNGNKAALGSLVTANDLHLHKAHVEQLKSDLERIKLLLPKLSAASDVYADALKLYTATLKAWSELSGISALFDLQQTIEKEQIKRAARVDKSGDTNERNVSGFNFDAVPIAALPTSREET